MEKKNDHNGFLLLEPANMHLILPDLYLMSHYESLGGNEECFYHLPPFLIYALTRPPYKYTKTIQLNKKNKKKKEHKSVSIFSCFYFPFLLTLYSCSNST